MSGWPNRINRNSLGPSRTNKWPVTNPAEAVDAETFNLEHWQLAGMNLVSARGLVGVTMTGTTPGTSFQALAWDPHQALPLLAWTRTGAGVYTYSFPSSQYPDMNGNPVTLTLLGAVVAAQGMTTGGNPAKMFHELTGPRSGTVRCFDNTSNAAADMASTKSWLIWFI